LASWYIKITLLDLFLLCLCYACASNNRIGEDGISAATAWRRIAKPTGRRWRHVASENILALAGALNCSSMVRQWARLYAPGARRAQFTITMARDEHGSSHGSRRARSRSLTILPARQKANITMAQRINRRVAWARAAG